jgi:hypothetical protein
MTFDSRAHRAVQGIHRAVEVMEMSSTKTPQKLTRFDRYRERKSRNQRIVALVVGIALPILLIAGAWRLFGSGGDSGIPADHSPTMTASESVTAQPVSGRSKDVFKAPFTYTVPGDWRFSGTGDRYMSFETPSAYGTDVIVLSSVVAAAPDCSKRPAQGVGTSSEAITTWLSTHPALDATTPHPVTLGAATGSYVDVQLASAWNGSCRPGLVLVTGAPDDPQNWGVYGTVKARFYVLDLPSGDTVTIVIADDESGTDFRSLIDEAAPVVESFRFLK